MKLGTIGEAEIICPEILIGAVATPNEQPTIAEQEGRAEQQAAEPPPPVCGKKKQGKPRVEGLSLFTVVVSSAHLEYLVVSRSFRREFLKGPIRSNLGQRVFKNLHHKVDLMETKVLFDSQRRGSDFFKRNMHESTNVEGLRNRIYVDSEKEKIRILQIGERQEADDRGIKYAKTAAKERNRHFLAAKRASSYDFLNQFSGGRPEIVEVRKYQPITYHNPKGLLFVRPKDSKSCIERTEKVPLGQDSHVHSLSISPVKLEKKFGLREENSLDNSNVRSVNRGQQSDKKRVSFLQAKTDRYCETSKDMSLDFVVRQQPHEAASPLKRSILRATGLDSASRVERSYPQVGISPNNPQAAHEKVQIHKKLHSFISKLKARGCLSVQVDLEDTQVQLEPENATTLNTGRVTKASLKDGRPTTASSLDEIRLEETNQTFTAGIFSSKKKERPRRTGGYCSNLKKKIEKNRLSLHEREDGLKDPRAVSSHLVHRPTRHVLASLRHPPLSAHQASGSNPLLFKNNQTFMSHC